MRTTSRRSSLEDRRKCQKLVSVHCLGRAGSRVPTNPVAGYARRTGWRGRSSAPPGCECQGKSSPRPVAFQDVVSPTMISRRCPCFASPPSIVAGGILPRRANGQIRQSQTRHQVLLLPPLQSWASQLKARNVDTPVIPRPSAVPLIARLDEAVRTKYRLPRTPVSSVPCSHGSADARLKAQTSPRAGNLRRWGRKQKSKHQAWHGSQRVFMAPRCHFMIFLSRHGPCVAPG